MRPATARAVLRCRSEARGPGRDESPPARLLESDPGWTLGRLIHGEDPDELAILSEAAWWPSLDGPAAESLRTLWRHAVAIRCAAWRCASERALPDALALARAGLLLNLGLWGLAAVAPERLAVVLSAADGAGRRELERSVLGTDAGTLGRELAERWGAPRLLADASWLHDTPEDTWTGRAAGVAALSVLRTARLWAERTPWTLHARPRDDAASDPRVRLLIAEVQVRCPGPLAHSDATPYEEGLTQSHAALLLRHDHLERRQAATGRFLKALARSSPWDDPVDWSEAAALAWCAEPEVTAVRADWPEEAAARPIRPTEEAIVPGGETSPRLVVRSGPDARPPRLDDHPALAGWRAWAAHVEHAARLAREVEGLAEANRLRHARNDHQRAIERLAALAEFAAGAAHELNNPLAVIMGRAQLLLGRVAEAEAHHSLRTIIGQAQRAHRILRDLIYVARPPSPRPRPCQVAELLRHALRDLEAESSSRGVRLETRIEEGPRAACLDPDPLRHLVEALTRNAVEATPAGGTVAVAARFDERRLDLAVRDGGAGLDPRAGAHLLDPFFCGRQAGRGLGLGLPRVARSIGLAGGSLRWSSLPGQGTTFRVRFPFHANEVAPIRDAGAGDTTAVPLSGA